MHLQPYTDVKDAELDLTSIWWKIPQQNKEVIWSQVALWVGMFSTDVIIALRTALEKIEPWLINDIDVVIWKCALSTPDLRRAIRSRLAGYFVERNS